MDGTSIVWTRDGRVASSRTRPAGAAALPCTLPLGYLTLTGAPGSVLTPLCRSPPCPVADFSYGDRARARLPFWLPLWPRFYVSGTRGLP
eukprot:6054465-Prymnesium_polylepis.2